LRLIGRLEKQYHGIEVFQHSDLDIHKPHCAGLDMRAWKKNYEAYTRLVGRG